MEPLATVDDLAARGIAGEPSTLDALLAAASAEVRNAAGVPITRSTVTVEIPGRPGQWLTLPGQPVVDATDVQVDGVPVPTGEWRRVGGRLWNRCGWQRRREPSVVTVTVTGGYVDVPADIVDLVCAMVGAGLARLEDGYETRSDLAYVSVDDYREGYLTSSGERLAGVMELPEATRRRLAARFGGSAVVVGVGR